MSVRKLSPLALLALAASVLVATSLGATDTRAPRIVSAAMLDADGDARADRVRLTFSERVRRAADRDGRYPFTVAGYRIRSVSAARGRTLVIFLAEKRAPDPASRPSIRYRRTSSNPLEDTSGKQAAAQTFKRTRSYGGTLVLPPESPPPPPPDPTLPPDTDPDRDGYAEPADCKPDDPAINPRAADLPDLAFVDSNCDGIDGTEAKAVFVSPSGNDASPGTKAQPKRQVNAAVTAAAATDRYVLVAFGSYGHVTAASGVGIYGGYDAQTWQRRDRYPDGLPEIVSVPEGLLADGATGVVLQHLAIRGLAFASQRSAYGIRAINGASLTLQRVLVGAGDGAAGPPGANGRPGANGGRGGLPSFAGPYCDAVVDYDLGGDGGDSTVGRLGGRGGTGGAPGNGEAGEPGRFGTPGGAGGASGTRGQPGSDGSDGSNGEPGLGGDGGTSTPSGAGASWIGSNGSFGRIGGAGNGGGGGGGGGGQTGLFVLDGTGNPGGGGGGGGAPGQFGDGGGFGGGSFGIYLFNSNIVAESSSVQAGNSGPGGRGGNGGTGGAGGAGAPGDDECLSEVGRGGNGGRGGDGGVGGAGGGGAGGPSIGVMKVGTSTATLTDTTVTAGQAGPGGAPGIGGTPGATPSQAGIAAPVYPA